MAITKEEFAKLTTNAERHKAMWTWLGENIHKSKEYFFSEMEVEDIPICMCYACETAERELNHTNDDCDGCPICEDGKNGSNCLNGRFRELCLITSDLDSANSAHEIQMIERKIYLLCITNSKSRMEESALGL